MKASWYKWMTPKWVKRVFNCWPVFVGSGIRIEEISDDFCYARVALKFSWWNKNANRTQYGGNIFSMTDPLYPFMLMGVFGPEYLIWDSRASIHYIKPGKSRLSAEFRLSPEMLAQIRNATANGDKFFPKFIVNIKDEKGDIVAKMERTLYIRRRNKQVVDISANKAA
ncbi:DUF4442 domain-containing protein [Vibrio gallicus]|uniref:DUF4442 domain-containing protein n=1 Tax=Vibrio gallicus TaxID=190897 RepID=UPI0021C42CA8|nr:DUF4442 domain-containing protein [Vibrio gallicus]